ncbi:MAG: hypothetical protein Q9219_001706 [cf. Caloplaca sp. 3 TL-2023]
MASNTFDLARFDLEGLPERKETAEELLEILTQHGFVKVINHGIPESMVHDMFEWSKAFFRLPAHEKLAIANPGGPEPQRGWSAVGSESSSSLYKKGMLKSELVEDLRDAREHFDQGSPKDLQFPTRWPKEQALPGFKCFMEGAFEKLEGVATRIMTAVETAYELPSGSLLNLMTHDDNASEMRLNHYPAIAVEEILGGKVSRIWPHFDLGVITLLFQDRVGGLEFENRQRRGAFHSVPCGDSAELVVNVSETLQRWTNGILPAGLHRVNYPPSLEAKTSGTLPERYSIAYFCKADRKASVGPLRQFVKKGSEPKYSDISAIDYHQQRLQSAY